MLADHTVIALAPPACMIISASSDVILPFIIGIRVWVAYLGSVIRVSADKGGLLIIANSTTINSEKIRHVIDTIVGLWYPRVAVTKTSATF